MAVVVDVVTPTTVANTSPNVTTVTAVVDVVSMPLVSSGPAEVTNLRTATTEVYKPVGTLANVSYGYGWPEHPYEGMVWIKLHE